MKTERYMDNYMFATKDENEFLSEMDAIRGASDWLEPVPGKDLSLSSVLPIEVMPLAMKYRLDEDTLRDTADPECTQLLLHIGDNRVECLRNTAYAGLLQTAVGLTGPGISRLWKRSSQIFCDSLNEFLKANGNSIKLYRCCGKISGAFSTNYKEMEIRDLYDEAVKSFQAEMGEPVFASGSIEHSITSCSWTFPDVEYDIMDEYRRMLDSKTQLYGSSFIPVVSFYSSNTGASAATLVPMFMAQGKAPFHVGRGVRIRHDSRQIGNATGCGMEAFRAQAADMFTLFKTGIAAMSEMGDVTILNPMNAFVSACNWAFGERLPRKFAAAALDTFMRLCDGQPCTMYDIYIGMTEINTEAELAGVGESRRIEIAESIARVLRHKNYNEFDVPSGVVAWNGTKGGAN